MNQFKKTIQVTLTLILFTLFSSNPALAQDGRVGIGTENPNAKLHVAGDMQVDDLAGEGDRNLVVDKQGKLKAVTNTTPNPSNEDTIRAKFIELIDDEGDTRFIFNAHTGEFQMLDNDTLWYELEVNSPPNETIRLDNGNGVESQTTSNNITLADANKLLDVVEEIEKTTTLLLIAIASTSGEAPEAEEVVKCLIKGKDILTSDTPTQLQTTQRQEKSSLIPGAEIKLNTFNVTTSGENGINTISITIREVIKPGSPPTSVTSVQSMSVSGQCQCQFGQESSVSEIDGETQEFNIVKNEGVKNQNITVFEKEEENEEEVLKEFSSLFVGLDESNDNTPPTLQQVFVNEQDGTSNTQNAKESTLKNEDGSKSISGKFVVNELGQVIPIDEVKDGNKSNTRGGGGTSIKDSEKETSIFTGLDENNSEPLLKFEGTDKETTFDADGIKQTDKETGELSEASLEDILKTAEDFSPKNEEQDNQINQNKDDISQNTSDISNLDDRVTEVENNSGGGSGSTTAPEFTASANGSTNKLQPEQVEISAADGNNAKFKKDGVILTAPDGTQLFIDCFGISKIKSGLVTSNTDSNEPSTKSLGFAGLSLDADNDKVVVDVDLEVFGTITEVGKKVNKIDHPDNPNQYLQHSTMGTAELLNFYNGTVTTNSKGRVTVELPSYVQSFNKDFRYQLTVIGGTFAQAIIAQEIENNQFVIRTNEPDIKVSWQITGVRNDVYAQQNPLEVEVNKAGNEVGKLYNSSSQQFNRKVERKIAVQSEEVVGDL